MTKTVIQGVELVRPNGGITSGSVEVEVSVNNDRSVDLAIRSRHDGLLAIADLDREQARQVRDALSAWLD